MMEDVTANSGQVIINAASGARVIAPIFKDNVFNKALNININVDDQNKVKEVPERVLKEHKDRLRKKFKLIREGPDKAETHLSEIYTELHVIERQSEMERESEHEIWRIERETQTPHQTPICCTDIFKQTPTYGPNADSKDGGEGDQEKDIKTVLTRGVAGIGKTVCVQKFILDWAEGKACKDVDYMIVMPFRELNFVNGDQYSLYNLISIFNPELKDLHPSVFENSRTVFIFDGLDEFRCPLTFTHHLVSDITKASPVYSLITNLIKGHLLPYSRIWITSRPAAASQIPSQYVNRLTEVQGFRDRQKEEYFRRRICDQDQANKIISHVKKVRSLQIMCCIPVFCWIIATTLQQTLEQGNSAEIPETMTELYINFLLTQVTVKNQKFGRSSEKDLKRILEANREIILKLAELAFKQLMRHKVMFYEEDLRECGIDVTEASVHLGFCTEILKEESVFYQRKVYCFIHLSFQEFLAALYVFHCYMSKNMETLSIFPGGYHPVTVPLHQVLQGALIRISGEKNGHLDLCIRFLVGISLESNQKLLQGLLTKIQSSSESIKTTIEFIKSQLQRTYVISPAENDLSLFFCLLEMKDSSIQMFLRSEESYEQELSVAYCSLKAYMLQTSEEVLDELDLKKVSTKAEGKRRLVTAAGKCRKALLSGSNLDDQLCEKLALFLQSENSPLTELDVSNNDIQDSGVRLLFVGLNSPKCNLKILRLAGCNLTKEVCGTLTTTLKSETSPLRELDLSNNDLQDSGVKLLSAGLKSPHCKLETLSLAICNISVKCCEDLASVLQSSNSHLKQLDLSNNDLQDSGVKFISDGLKSPHCKLETIKLSGCMITEEGCCSLASALQSNPSQLRELDMSYNHPGESGTKLLSASCKLEILTVDHCGELRIKPGLRKYACALTLDPNTASTELALSDENRKITWVGQRNPYPGHPDRFESVHQVLCNESLSGRHYWEAEYSGGWQGCTVAVAYKGIGRKGNNDECCFGSNRSSWSLSCSTKNCRANHSATDTIILPPCDRPRSKRVAVYLDWPAGVLSFYSVSSDTRMLTHIHTYHATFTEPLYAGFRVWKRDISVSLCHLDEVMTASKQ